MDRRKQNATLRYTFATFSSSSKSLLIAEEHPIFPFLLLPRFTSLSNYAISSTSSPHHPPTLPIIHTSNPLPISKRNLNSHHPLMRGHYSLHALAHSYDPKKRHCFYRHCFYHLQRLHHPLLH